MAASTPENRITALALTNFRNDRRRFGIKRADRRAYENYPASLS